MANPDIIRKVTLAIRGILKKAVGDIVVIAPPDQTPTANEALLVYLYQVEECAMKNQGPRTAVPGPPYTSPAVSTRDPLSINLHYLLIPTAQNETEPYLGTFVILGKAMRAMYDAGSFTLGEWVDSSELDLGDKDLQFRICLNPLSTHDLFELWQAVNQPYRVSVSYVVRTAHIDSELKTQAMLVSERRIQTG